MFKEERNYSNERIKKGEKEEKKHDKNSKSPKEKDEIKTKINKYREKRKKRHVDFCASCILRTLKLSLNKSILMLFE